MLGTGTHSSAPLWRSNKPDTLSEWAYSGVLFAPPHDDPSLNPSNNIGHMDCPDFFEAGAGRWVFATSIGERPFGHKHGWECRTNATLANNRTITVPNRLTYVHLISHT